MIKLIFLLSIFFITPAFAYFDPGSGAFIIQAIIAFFAAISFYLGYPIRIIKRFFTYIKNKIFKKKDNNTN
jgi:hypothetical protein